MMRINLKIKTGGNYRLPCDAALEGSCADGGECCSGYCYADADADGYAPEGGSKTCRASAPTYSGTDCDDICSTCFPGSTAATSSPDGKDQNCDGSTDNQASVPATKICTGEGGCCTNVGKSVETREACNEYCGYTGSNVNYNKVTCNVGTGYNQQTYRDYDFFNCNPV